MFLAFKLPNASLVNLKIRIN